jgi:hypothetical protein
MTPQTVTPQLRITDHTKSLPFYVEGLGFHVDWEHRFEPGFPLFAQVSRGGQALFLTEHAVDCKVGGAAYIVVADVDALHREPRHRRRVRDEEQRHRRRLLLGDADQADRREARGPGLLAGDLDHNGGPDLVAFNVDGDSV